jgi:hypothetical protein
VASSPFETQSENPEVLIFVFQSILMEGHHGFPLAIRLAVVLDRFIRQTRTISFYSDETCPSARPSISQALFEPDYSVSPILLAALRANIRVRQRSNFGLVDAAFDILSGTSPIQTTDLAVQVLFFSAQVITGASISSHSDRGQVCPSQFQCSER